MQMAAPFSNSHATQRMQFVIISHFPIPIDWNQPPADNRRHFQFSASMRRALWIETEVGVKQSFIRTESRISETMENEVNSRKACQIANLRRLRWRELVLPNSIRFASVSSLSVFSYPRMEFFFSLDFFLLVSDVISFASLAHTLVHTFYFAIRLSLSSLSFNSFWFDLVASSIHSQESFSFCWFHSSMEHKVVFIAFLISASWHGSPPPLHKFYSITIFPLFPCSFLILVFLRLWLLHACVYWHVLDFCLHHQARK